MDNNFNNSQYMNQGQMNPRNPYDTNQQDLFKSPGNGKKPHPFRNGLLIGIFSTVGVLLICSFVLLTSIGFFSHDNLLNGSTVKKLYSLNSIINEYYYKDVDENDLRNGLYKGLFEGINDKYTEYYTKEEAEELEESLTGNYAGVGMGLSQDQDTKVVTVSFVYDDTPAKKAGIKKGDIVISAAGTEATSMDLSDFVELIRGEEGTTVDVVIKPEGSTDEKTITLKRESITIPTVSYKLLDNNVGYIRISQFTTDTAKEFHEALETLKGQGMTSVIFDLRDNPGGLVDAVTAMLDEILPEGTVVYTVDNKGRREDYTSDDEHQLDIPMAVLINENSASASEIFSGAIRDFKAGTLIGKTSYGKGVVQTTLPLRDGSMVKLTTMEYFTPSGENIQGKGITPDIDCDYDYTGDADALAKKDSDEYTSEDYLNDTQIKKAYDTLTGL